MTTRLLSVFMLVGLFVTALSCRAEERRPTEALKVLAPAIARTSSTALLLWNRSPLDKVAAYEILRDGAPAGRTRQLSHIATELEAGRTYRFAVRAIDWRGDELASSEALSVTTKNAGETLNVRSRGARGDGVQDDTAPIQRAINECPPGGTVLVPPGEYRVKPLELKDDFTLHLTAGSTLRFMARDEIHLVERTIELPGPDGPVSVAFGALITGVRTNNVSIIGAGTIAGNGETWWPHHESYRPKLLEVVDARNLLVQGITLEDPPFWNTHPIYMDKVVFAGVTFLKRSAVAGTNGDGLNPDSCRDVLIVGCSFGNQDDSIAIKSGKLTATQTRRQRPSENITIRECHFGGGLAPGAHPLGIAIGSENCGGVRNVGVSDCTFTDTASIINLKANRDRRHALVENVRVEHCTYVNTVFGDEPWNRAPISLDLFYYGRADEDPDFAKGPVDDAPWFRGIHFRDIVIANPKGRVIYLSGLAERPLRDITFTNIVAAGQAGFFARNVDELTLDGVVVATSRGPACDWGVNVTKRQIRSLENGKLP